MLQTGSYAYKKSASNIVESKEQILLKLYRGMLNFLSLARRGIEINSPKIRGENISKTLAILTELDCALDMDTGGELSENLSALYRHMMYKLTDANLKNDAGSIDEVVTLLNELYEGFEEAAKIVLKKPAVVPQGVTAVPQPQAAPVKRMSLAV